MMESVNPMEARQRRMELRRQSASKKRCLDYDDSIDHNDDDDDDDSSFSSSSSSSKGNSATSSFTIQDSKMKNKKHKGLEAISSNSDVDLSMYRGIKKQARYEPTIPISSKAELAAWRKEARRIRNRESAAASRNKTRERIDELEGQLQTMQNQYSTALQRIVELESLLQQQGVSKSVALPPQVSSVTDSTTIRVSPALLPSEPIASPTDLCIGAALRGDDWNTEETELLIWSPDQQSAAEALANSLMYDITPPLQENATVPNVVAPDQIPQVAPPMNHVSDIRNGPSITLPSTYSNTLFTTHQDIKISRPTAVCVASNLKHPFFIKEES